MKKPDPDRLPDSAASLRQQNFPPARQIFVVAYANPKPRPPMNMLRAILFTTLLASPLTHLRAEEPEEKKEEPSLTDAGIIGRDACFAEVGTTSFEVDNSLLVSLGGSFPMGKLIDGNAQLGLSLYSPYRDNSDPDLKTLLASLTIGVTGYIPITSNLKYFVSPYIGFGMIKRDEFEENKFYWGGKVGLELIVTNYLSLTPYAGSSMFIASSENPDNPAEPGLQTNSGLGLDIEVAFNKKYGIILGLSWDKESNRSLTGALSIKL